MGKRKRKGAIVEKVENKATGRTGAVRLEKSTMYFFARVPDDGTVGALEFESKDGRAVRDWLQTELAKTSEDALLDWVPVVKVVFGGTDRSYRSNGEFAASLSVEYERFYLALTQDRTEWRKLDWEQCDPESPGAFPPEDRLANSSRYTEGPQWEGPQSTVDHGRLVKIPMFRTQSRRKEVLLPYSADLWAALGQITSVIDDQETLLDDLLGTKTGLALLIEIGAGRAPLQLQASGE